MLRLTNLILIAALTLVATPSLMAPVQAGNGFPPFGAWAYGTRGPGWTGHHVAFNHHRGFHGHHHRSHFRGGWHTSYRVAPVFPVAYYPPIVYRPAAIVYRAPVVGWSSFGTGLSVGYSSWGFHAPFVHAPFVPTVNVCNPWYTPSYSVSYGHASLGHAIGPVGGASTLSISSIGWPLAADTGRDSRFAPASNVTTARFDNGSFAGSSGSAPAHYVVLDEQQASGQAPPQPVPAELLDIADRMLELQGYREAATAYARLTARFGSNSQLLARRFVAQVLSQDFAQATVVAASARLLEQPIDRSLLPGESLSGLGIPSSTVDRISEQLAEYALARPDDSAALAAVAYWLSLTGQDETSALFLARVDQLEGQGFETNTEASTPQTIAERRDMSSGRSKTTFTAVK